MDSVMIQDNNKWNCHHLNLCDDEMMTLRVPPPSPQDASLLETVFSKHLSAKMHTQQPTIMNSHHHSAELHARKLNGLLLSCKLKRSRSSAWHKRPSHIPILSSRVIHKKKTKQDLSKAFERISISNDKQQEVEQQHKNINGLATMVMNMNKKDKMDKIVQGLKEMGL
jgi:hypothetical protein